jgi:hypothetical protein
LFSSVNGISRKFLDFLHFFKINIYQVSVMLPSLEMQGTLVEWMLSGDYNNLDRNFKRNSRASSLWNEDCGCQQEIRICVCSFKGFQNSFISSSP